MGSGSVMIEYILTNNYWTKEWIQFKLYLNLNTWEIARASTTLRIQMMGMNIYIHNLKPLTLIKHSLALISRTWKPLMKCWFLFHKGGLFSRQFSKNQVLIMDQWTLIILCKNSRLINKNGLDFLKIIKYQLSNLENLRKSVFTYIH